MRLLMNPLALLGLGLLSSSRCSSTANANANANTEAHTATVSMDVTSGGWIRKAFSSNTNSNNATSIVDKVKLLKEQHFPFDLAAERLAKKKRMKERRERGAATLAQISPDPEQLERVDPDDAEQQRKLGNWFSGSTSSSPYSTDVLADPSQDYDKWAQAYRMLGGFIDCDHSSDGDDHSGDNNEDEQDEAQGACSRWMMWASYVNPNYQGYGYDEYYGDDATGRLDCHSPNTEWKLLGVYRQEFYQYIEQISKHVWAIDDYEYVVALAGLSYMTDEDCYAVGADSSGNTIYAGVAPQQYGKFEMALYTDEYCIQPDENTGYSYSDLVGYSDIDLGSEDETDDDGYSWASDWWYSAQEYTLTDLNDVYEEFKYCTACMDYPTYQDGYFIGDDGTDDDDIINQCWKFHSHDSFTCEADCIAKAHAQGTILSVQYGQATFGKTMSGFYSETSSSGKSSAAAEDESPISRLAANSFLTLSFLLFVATFLAFAVARRSRYRESRSSRSRRLLDDETDGKSTKSRRTSKSKAAGDGDGLFRSTGSRSKSKDKKKRSSSKSKSRKSRSKSYEPPNDGGVKPPRNSDQKAEESF